MIDFVNQALFAQPGTDKQFVITVYENDGTSTGTVITNKQLYYQQIEFTMSLCSEKTLTYGACESNSIKFQVTSSVPTLKNKKLVVKVRLGTSLVYLDVGTYYVESDKVSNDKNSREIVAYDAMKRLLEDNVSGWYSQLEFPMSLKDFRDSFFEYEGITQISATLANDTMPITQTIIPEGLTGKTVLNAICAGNGCFGQIRNDSFRYVVLSDSATKTYTSANYKMGSLVCQDYEVYPPTQLVFTNNKTTVTVGTNPFKVYEMEDNFLFYDKVESELTPFVRNILDVIMYTPAYTPLQFEVYGDLCVEPGDKIVVTDKGGVSYTTFCMDKTTKGLLSLTDEFVTEGNSTYFKNLNSTGNKILTIWNNTKVLIEEMNGARSYVYAQRPVKSGDFHITHTDETEIVKIHVTTVDTAIPVFVATIPITMDSDGEVVFKYYLDGARIEADADTVYLHKGDNCVTLSTYFAMDANIDKYFTVTAQTKYKESEERKQQAKILSINDWIDNQSLSIDETTGQPQFDYDYIDYPVDNTPPQATIGTKKIRAVLFGSGLQDSAAWDGTILISEQVSDFDLSQIEFEDIFETITLDLDEPTAISITENVSDWDIAQITFDSVTESVTINLYIGKFNLITEDGIQFVTEDGIPLVTEHD